MKKLLFLIAGILMMAGCNKSEPKVTGWTSPSGKIESSRDGKTVIIRQAQSANVYVNGVQVIVTDMPAEDDRK